MYSGSSKKRKVVNSMRKNQYTPKKEQKKPELLDLFERMKRKKVESKKETYSVDRKRNLY